MSDRYDDLAKRDFFSELMALRDRQRARQLAGNANILLKGNRIKEQLSPWGRIKWYMHPTIEDNPARTLMVWSIAIAPGSRSGNLQCQGGHVYFVWKGSAGVVTIDDDAHEWGHECVLNIPLRPPGLRYQFINQGEDEAVLVGVCMNMFDMIGVDAGTSFDVVEPCPEWQALQKVPA